MQEIRGIEKMDLAQTPQQAERSDSERGDSECARDAERVRATLAGDQRAFVALYDRYARLVQAICHDETGNLSDAQDLCQEVFLRAFRNLGRLRDPERFAAWLLGMTRMT